MNRWQWAGLFIVILGLGGVAYVKTRGLRNNNPGNLRDTGENWRGLDTPRNDGAYLRFVDAKWGLRALAKVLHNYQHRHGLKTIRQIIHRYAPPSENATDAYVNDVASRLGVSPDSPINVDARMPDLLAAITYHENGIQPYSAQTLIEATRMAGIPA